MLEMSNPRRSLYDEIVIVNVGKEPNNKEFHVHKGLICHFSTYFNATFNGSFKEAVEKRVDLSEDEIKVFQAFYNLIYTNRLHDETEMLPSRQIAKLMTFGEVRGIPLLQNAAMNELISKFESKWVVSSSFWIPWACKNTVRGSPLWRFLVHLHSNVSCRRLNEWLPKSDDKAELAELVPFLVDLSVAQNVKLRENDALEFRGKEASIDRCHFHVQ